MTYNIICVLIFYINIYCLIFHKKNLVINLIFIELAFLSLSLMLIINSWSFNLVKSYLIVIYILTLTAIETALGLALFIVYYKQFNSIEAEDFYKLKF